MEIRPDVLAVILGGALVTVLPRVLPLVVLARLELPTWLRQWLGYVPIAIMAALLASELALDAGALAFKWRELLAIAPVFAIIAATRSIIGAVVAGVATIAALRFIS